MMRIAWTTVGAIIQRVVDRLSPEDRLDGLTHIGVDELSYRKHHEYVTVVIDHQRQRIVWAAKGKSADTLREFFQALGPERCKKLENVTIDMSAAYIKAVSEAAPQARIVFDKFHVQRLAHDALDQVRRAEVRKTAEPASRAALKHTRFALQKSPWNLTSVEHEKLSEVQRTNRRIYRAYLLKETLAEILSATDAGLAKTKLGEWTRWASHSKLALFVRVARTIRRHVDGIVAYVATGLTNARTEGLNGKARTITRRSYGLHSAASLIAMLFLCCSDLALARKSSPWPVGQPSPSRVYRARAHETAARAARAKQPHEPSLRRARAPGQDRSHHGQRVGVAALGGYIGRRLRVCGRGRRRKCRVHDPFAILIRLFRVSCGSDKWVMAS
jgi:transposase